MKPRNQNQVSNELPSKDEGLDTEQNEEAFRDFIEELYLSKLTEDLYKLLSRFVPFEYIPPPPPRSKYHEFMYNFRYTHNTLRCCDDYNKLRKFYKGLYCQ